MFPTFKIKVSEVKKIREKHNVLLKVSQDLQKILAEFTKKAKSLMKPASKSDTDFAANLFTRVPAWNAFFSGYIENKVKQFSSFFEEHKATEDTPRKAFPRKILPVRPSTLQKRKVYIESSVSDISDQESDTDSYAPSNATNRLIGKRGHYKISSIQQRQNAIAEAELYGVTEASKKFKIPAKNIKRWLKTGIERKKGGGRKTLDPQMEEKLYAWIKSEEVRLGHGLTRTAIKNKAKEFSTCESFKASKGWLDKFKRRCNVTFMPMANEKQQDTLSSSNFEAESTQTQVFQPDESCSEKQEYCPNEEFSLSQNTPMNKADDVYLSPPGSVLYKSYSQLLNEPIGFLNNPDDMVLDGMQVMKKLKTESLFGDSYLNFAATFSMK